MEYLRVFAVVGSSKRVVEEKPTDIYSEQRYRDFRLTGQWVPDPEDR